MPIIERALQGLAGQDLPHRLMVLDNGSLDGTREAAKNRADLLLDVHRGSYRPGQVLNRAMRASEGEVVIFLNSDCLLLGPDSLRQLVAPFQDPSVVATFGRQVPRPDCHPLQARDTEKTFGDGVEHQRWRHCFSMAFSAIRRSAWESQPFDEILRYSEDVDWTWRWRQAGARIVYVPEAVAEHSHNYTLSQSYRRHFGEGEADARIFSWAAWEGSLLRFTLLPWLRQTACDLAWCLGRGDWRNLLYAPLLRGAQHLGRRAGFLAGQRGR